MIIHAKSRLQSLFSLLAHFSVFFIETPEPRHMPHLEDEHLWCSKTVMLGGQTKSILYNLSRGTLTVILLFPNVDMLISWMSCEFAWPEMTKEIGAGYV